MLINQARSPNTMQSRLDAEKVKQPCVQHECEPAKQQAKPLWLLRARKEYFGNFAEELSRPK